MQTIFIPSIQDTPGAARSIVGKCWNVQFGNFGGHQLQKDVLQISNIPLSVRISLHQNYLFFFVSPVHAFVVVFFSEHPLWIDCLMLFLVFAFPFKYSVSWNEIIDFKGSVGQTNIWCISIWTWMTKNTKINFIIYELTKKYLNICMTKN